MYLKSLEINGFKSFAKKVSLDFVTPITAIVGPNGSGKSNTAEAFRFVLGEQSLKNMRGKKGEDLIFTGTAGRVARASVKVTLDNSKKQFPVDFRDVTIERAVLRDGANEYMLNGSKVRAKDITELLSAAHIGSSGHHIISQGEADRIISLNPRDRKDVLEEGLGLRIYSIKKQEALRKLEKTDANLAEVEVERKVVAPKLRMLKKEVEKIAESERLRAELRDLYKQFFPTRFTLINQKKDSQEKLDSITRQLTGINEELEQKNRESRSDIVQHKKEDERKEREEKQLQLRSILQNISDAQLSLGKISARIEIAEEQKQRIERNAASINENSYESQVESVSGIIHDMWRSWVTTVSEKFFIPEDLAKHWAEDRIDYADLPELEKDKDRVFARSIMQSLGMTANKKPEVFNQSEYLALVERGEKTRMMLAELAQQENQLRERIIVLEQIIASESSSETSVKINILQLEKQQESVRNEKQNMERLLSDFAVKIATYEREEVYARDMYGVEVAEWLSETSVAESPEMNMRDKIQRLKILLENMDGDVSRDAVTEYEELRERDDFIAKEITDLRESAESLRALIADLSATIADKFEAGLSKVNKEFNTFFSTLFSGGKAELKLLPLANKSGDEDDGLEKEYGVEIVVSLPNKKISGLAVLSGGERSLTSIALLFAMSAVNPPPFIILDETDAALDEANSKRYGDMVELLSRNSQLILITHNRETMSRAETLYGVTMDREGVSKLLSVRLEEAVAVAK